MTCKNTTTTTTKTNRSIQSWKLADLKRDDYAPNTPGQRQWEMDRKKWLAQRLVDVVKVSCTPDVCSCCICCVRKSEGGKE